MELILMVRLHKLKAQVYVYQLDIFDDFLIWMYILVLRSYNQVMKNQKYQEILYMHHEKFLKVVHFLNYKKSDKRKNFSEIFLIEVSWKVF